MKTIANINNTQEFLNLLHDVMQANENSDRLIKKD